MKFDPYWHRTKGKGNSLIAKPLPEKHSWGSGFISSSKEPRRGPKERKAPSSHQERRGPRSL